jgi:hypothetical protein
MLLPLEEVDILADCTNSINYKVKSENVDIDLTNIYEGHPGQEYLRSWSLGISKGFLKRLLSFMIPAGMEGIISGPTMFKAGST